MMDVPTQADSGEQFYRGTLKRVGRFIVVMSLLGIPFVVYWWKVPGLIGYCVGGVLGYLNFLWLRRSVEAIGAHITEQGSREDGSSSVVKGFLRYALVGVGGYVIFEGSKNAFYAFLVGLFLPVFGMLCEAAYELYGALRRGF